MKYFYQLKETVTSVKSDSPLICRCPFSCSSSPQHGSHRGFTNTPLCWQNQLKQLLPPQRSCFIAGGAVPSASSTDVAQHQASKQLYHHFWKGCMGARKRSGNWQKKFRLAFLAHVTAAVHQHWEAQASTNAMTTWTTQNTTTAALESVYWVSSDTAYLHMYSQ